ncbi:MAG: MobA/MobL family protein [Veillonellales bacterium]
MALYLLSVKTIGRTQNRPSVEAAAYRSGEKLYDERKDIIYDFTRKKGIVHTEIVLPNSAPSEFSNRKTLWNAVEHAEKRRDSRTTREIVLALPRELTLETSKALVRKFVSICFIQLGMCADICIHAGLNKNTNHNETERKKLLPHNPHAHIMLRKFLIGIQNNTLLSGENAGQIFKTKHLFVKDLQFASPIKAIKTKVLTASQPNISVQLLWQWSDVILKQN